MAIFKNEAMGIREWIEHYKWQGVDEILLLDNNSSDDWRHKIVGLENNVTIMSAPRDHVQTENYVNLGLPWLKANGVQVVAILDLDEYMFGTDGRTLKEHIVEVFGSVGRPSQFTCKWHMFGSSGLEEQPESIRASFTWKKSEEDWNIKSVFWLDDLVNTNTAEGVHKFFHGVNQHTCKVSGVTLGCPSGLQLNHYSIQSKEFYEKIKIQRGAVDKHDNTHNWDFFKENDFKEEEDTKLKTLVLQ
jgi:hypothetical protein